MLDKENKKDTIYTSNKLIVAVSKLKEEFREKEEMVKTLKISERTHERLKKHGQFGDSFDDILNRLLDIAEGKAKK